eukprot:TRINITY_DN3573_c0_g1_i1.p1 TRINITY_DN3573_c0_g1~~TRINITY_DN3573_c0_g1_i1.p1  ORF type:complete len:439 (-),score=107.66 TRINITY_DN3573_c0_g1_i1:73-1275(-)
MGDLSKTKEADLEERYKALKVIADSHTVLSVGLSCFESLDGPSEPKEPSPSSPQECRTNAWTFTFLVRSLDDFTSSPSSLKFLVEHGMDFNMVFSQGIPFSKKNLESSQTPNAMQCLFKHITSLKKPIAVHNGLLDLLFLYNSFICALPPTLAKFVADLKETFGEIIDTKYIAEVHAKEKLTFLEYVHKKSDRLNKTNKEKGLKHFNLIDKTEEVLQYLHQHSSPEIKPTPSCFTLCPNFQSLGYCKNISLCNYSHSVDQLLDIEDKLKESQKKHKRKRTPIHLEKPSKKKNQTLNMFDVLSHLPSQHHSDSDSENPSTEEIVVAEGLSEGKEEEKPVLRNPHLEEASQKHNAGFDSYCTGLIYSHYKLTIPSNKLSDLSNKLFLMGKKVPLIIYKSQFL